MRNHVLRRARRSLARKLRSGSEELRVVGSETSGFALGSADLQFPSRFKKQKEAVAVGLTKFAQQARKLLRVSQKAA